MLNNEVMMPIYQIAGMGIITSVVTIVLGENEKMVRIVTVVAELVAFGYGLSLLMEYIPKFQGMIASTFSRFM